MLQGVCYRGGSLESHDRDLNRWKRLVLRRMNEMQTEIANTSSSLNTTLPVTEVDIDRPGIFVLRRQVMSYPHRGCYLQARLFVLALGVL